MYFGVASESCM